MNALLRPLWASLVLVWGALPTQADEPRNALPLDAEQIQPGLAAEYRSLVDSKAILHQVDRKPAFYLGMSSPHPQLPPGPMEVTWRGIIHLHDAGPLHFSGLVGGEIDLRIAGESVLSGTGPSDTKRLESNKPLNLEPGYYPLEIRFRSQPGIPARVQLFWEGPGFDREPIPAWRFGHLAANRTKALEAAEITARGKTVAVTMGCANCHRDELPGITEPPPGPNLATIGRRVNRDWLLQWLDDPAKMRSHARMPALFGKDRNGFMERWLIAEYLTRDATPPVRNNPRGDHRAGRTAFLGMGCATCHLVPDGDRVNPPDPQRTALDGLADRFGEQELVEFLANPHGRYPDGRMPRLPIPADTARNIAAYLLLWSRPTEVPKSQPPSADELRAAMRRLGARDAVTAATRLLQLKGCNSCHSGLGTNEPLNHPIQTADAGCLGDKQGPRFRLEPGQRDELIAYLKVATQEKYPSPYASRQRALQRAGCVRCHQRDTLSPPPIEAVGSTLGGAFLEELPFQRTPRLSNPHQKFTRAHLLRTVRDGVSGLRPPRYTYRMPAFGIAAEVLVQAIAEGDGESPYQGDAAEKTVDDPTLGTVHGPTLVSSQGYSCISCHAWNGRQLVVSDPGAAASDLTRLSGRVRRDWFDRFLNDPQRVHPGTPMPGVFERGQPARLPSILDGDAARQKDALWAYFARGANAPEPKPVPPLPIAGPTTGQPPLVAQIPIRLSSDGKLVESLSLLTDSADLLVYDLATGGIERVVIGAAIHRTVQGRTRQYLTSGTEVGDSLAAPEPYRVLIDGKATDPLVRTFLGYDLIPSGATLRWSLRQKDQASELTEHLRLENRTLVRELRFKGLPRRAVLEVQARDPRPLVVEAASISGVIAPQVADGITTYSVSVDPDGNSRLTVRYKLPAPQAPRAWVGQPIGDAGQPEGSLQRPGYQAIAYPRPKTVSGEDRIMPAALAADPVSNRVFVASLKTGELFAVNDPDDDGRRARFDLYARGLFQDALSMYADRDGLFILHRRNLTRIRDTNGDGVADRVDRIAHLPHGVADSYDYAYGLVRERSGGFVISYAPYANTTLPGSGSAIRLRPDGKVEEIAFGMRNPLGWCAGPDGEIFFTDNQGEWVPTNKLCHVVPGRYYGFPNSAQRQHMSKPAGRTAVWVPYSWARSINGVTYDNTGGKFGPFAGQFFLAELMFGGAIIRAEVEKVNGEYQGCCFPFWGKGLMGPVCLTFDPKGRLFVGGITEPGWMAQPDRGALFRIDYTGQMPFEIKSIHARPQGFKLIFTREVDRRLAADPASYRIEHFRYEITGAYGSPELDRTAVTIKQATVSADGLSVELTTSPLVANRVYMVSAPAVKSPQGEVLVHPTGAYTMNEVPKP